MAHLVLTAVCVAVLVLVGRFLVKAYSLRSQMHALPGPPHSMIWGHLRMMGEMMQEVPPQVHGHVMPLRIQKKYNIQTNYFYLDFWPFADPMLLVFDPSMAQQVTVDKVALKHYALADVMRPMTGPGDLVSSDGPHWKKWRSIMNPGFAGQHLMSLVPGIVDDCQVFADKMSEHADKNDVFRLEEYTTRLTVDIIGKVALDLKLETQHGDNEMVTAFRNQVRLLIYHGSRRPFDGYSPVRLYQLWQNERIMKSYIGKVLDERFAKSESDIKPGQKKQRKRAIIDLALDSYLSQQNGDNGEKGQTTSRPVMDAEFRSAAITQIRTFIFAGHDTTSALICYVLYMLQKNPECLSKIRQEHEAILGSVERTAQSIKDDPFILNKLEYTLAVIKETLRLWPAASATRQGDANVAYVYDPTTGEQFPTRGNGFSMLIWIVHYAMHRSPAVWGESANVFDPSRFLPENEAKLPANAWRPFERGPRNCIGQELAMLESRVALALTVRTFDFRIALDSLDELKNDGSALAIKGKRRKGKQDLDGEEMYSLLVGTAKPREGMPVRVKKVAGAS